MIQPISPRSLRAAGTLITVGALGFVVVFSVLAATFGYPDVLDRGAAEVLPALVAGGTTLKAWWIVYAVLPLFISSAALLAAPHLARLGGRGRLFTAAGVAAGVAMAIGLARWSTLQWSLGESWLAADAGTRATLEAVSDAVHRMLGNGLGEVVGEVLLGTWLIGAGLSTRAGLDEARATRGLVVERGVVAVTVVLGLLMLLGALRFAVPALAAVTAVTNLLLPIGLVALGLTWGIGQRRDALPSRLGGKTMAALVALVAVGVAAVPSAGRAETAKREIILHGFRAPSMGVELREDWIGFHVGFYPTILDKDPDGARRTTWFAKTGVTFYPFQFDTGSGRPSGPYLGVALMQGLDNDWDAARSATSGAGGFFDIGFRWAAFKGFDLRLGVGLLVGFDGRTAVNPTPGFSWAIPY